MTTSKSAVAVYPTHVGSEQAIKELQEAWLAMFLMLAALAIYVMTSGRSIIPR